VRAGPGFLRLKGAFGMEIHCYPDHVLRRRALPVRKITDEVWELAQSMLGTMYEADGVGLAAPQVGESVRLVTIDTTGEQQEPRVFVNPRITEQRGEVEGEEGCLSLPGLSGKVVRADWLAVTAYDLEGRKLEMEVEGLAARAFQHELDHLRGVLFIDHLSPTERMALRRRLKEMEREFEERGGRA
jgi:peptide deformylase